MKALARVYSALSWAAVVAGIVFSLGMMGVPQPTGQRGTLKAP